MHPLLLPCPLLLLLILQWPLLVLLLPRTLLCPLLLLLILQSPILLLPCTLLCCSARCYCC